MSSSKKRERAIVFSSSLSSAPSLPSFSHLQLRLRRVLSQRAHDRAELLGRDRAVAVLVEEREGLLFVW